MNISKCIDFQILLFRPQSIKHSSVMQCCDISLFSYNVLCAIVILLKIFTRASLWPTIKAETCCALYNKYFAITVLIDALLIPSSILQNPKLYLTHRSLTSIYHTCFLCSESPDSNIFVSWLCSVTFFVVPLSPYKHFPSSKPNYFTAEHFWSFPFIIH